MQDILTDDTGEIILQSGDLLIGFSDQQHQEHLLMFEKGALKENISTGVGVFRFIEAEKPNELLKEVAIQFTGDGMQVDQIIIEGEGKLTIKAAYK